MLFPVIQEFRLLLLVVVATAIATHVYAGVLPALPVYGISILLLFLFRSVPRTLEAMPLAVLSPVDGVVRNIEKVHDPILDRQAWCIQVKQSRLGEFVLHCPIEGQIVERWWPDKSGVSADNFGFHLQADEGDECVVDVVNARAPRFKTHTIPSGQRTRQGQLCGVIGMGVLVNVYVSETSAVRIQVGERVKAGQAVLAKLREHAVRERIHPASSVI